MKRLISILEDCHGSITVMTVIMIFIFVGLLAFVIDLAHVKTVKTELSNAADDCALRGARAFLPDELPVSPFPVKMDPDPDRAKGQAQIAVQDNKSDNNAFQLGDLPLGDIEVGIWDYVNKTLLNWEWPPPSNLWGEYIGPGVRVPTNRDENVSLGSVVTSLARVFGIDTVDVHARATAALSAYGGPTEGSPILPFGTWDDQIQDPGQVLHGTFGVDWNDKIGWTNLNPADNNPNANELKKIMDQGALYDCPYGSTVGIQNGVASTVIKEMIKQNPFNRFGLVDPDGDKVYQPSTDTNPYADIDPKTGARPSYADTVYMMPVFTDGSHGGDKFNQSAVVGGIPVQIVEVADSPGNYIDIRFLEGTYWASGHGGGRFYGILTTEPKLVQ